ncbi:MAG: MAPEG family protein, partial [Hyphomicrobiaceae bacterium]
MQPSDIILPVAAQAALTVVILLGLLPARFFSMKGDGLKLDDRDVRLGLNVWSDQAQRTHNSYKSQFELPVLFYAVAAFSMLAGAVDQTMVMLAWVFVGLRIAHAIIHNGP